jgi:hypothetical protein
MVFCRHYLAVVGERRGSEGQNGVTSCSIDEANMSVMQNCYFFASQLSVEYCTHRIRMLMPCAEILISAHLLEVIVMHTCRRHGGESGFSLGPYILCF